MNNKNKRQKNLISCGKKKKNPLSYMTNAHRVMHNDHLFLFKLAREKNFIEVKRNTKTKE